MSTRLTRNITLEELATTSHRGLKMANLAAAKDHSHKLTLVAEMLQVIRDHFGRPVIVHSGIRSPELNAAIGGSKTSQHMKGEAADFHVAGVELEKVFEFIRSSELKFGQVILEGSPPSWIHLSLGEPFRPSERSRQVMVWTKEEGYRYLR